MFLQQGQGSHAAVAHNLFIGDNRDIHQRKSAGIQLLRQSRLLKFLQPIGRIRIWTTFAGIEQHRNDQRQLFIAGVKVTLHGGNGVADKAKRHMFIRARLVLNKHVNITISAGGRFQAVEHVTEILAQVVFDKGSGLQLQRTEIADGPQFCRQMDLHKVTGNLGLRQKLPECRIMGKRFFSHPLFISSFLTVGRPEPAPDIVTAEASTYRRDIAFESTMFTFCTHSICRPAFDTSKLTKTPPSSLLSPR